MGTVGSRLRDARRRRGWSQLRLAAEAEVGHATVERLERGEAMSRVENLRAMAEALEVQVGWLIDGREPMVLPAQMTVDQQFRTHSGPGTEGRPGFVIIDPGGPWERGADGEWRADETELAREVRSSW